MLNTVIWYFFLNFRTAGRKVFREFLRSEYSEENMLFWLACEEIKREDNPEVVEEKARNIYEDYISILSPKEVCTKVSILLSFIGNRCFCRLCRFVSESITSNLRIYIFFIQFNFFICFDKYDVFFFRLV